MHCGCCEQSQYVNLLIVCLTLYSFVFFLRLTLLQVHKLLCYWKYLNIKAYGTFFWGGVFVCFVFFSVVFIATRHSGYEGIVGKKQAIWMTGIHLWEISECLLRVLGGLWLSDLPAESRARCYYLSLRKILFAVRCLAVFTLSYSDRVYTYLFLYQQQLDCFITTT